MITQATGYHGTLTLCPGICILRLWWETLVYFHGVSLGSPGLKYCDLDDPTYYNSAWLIFIVCVYHMCAWICGYMCPYVYSEARGGCQVFCSITSQLIPLRQAFSPNWAVLTTSKPQSSFCLWPAAALGLQLATWLLGSELRSSCLCSKCSYPLSHLSSPSEMTQILHQWDLETRSVPQYSMAMKSYTVHSTCLEFKFLIEKHIINSVVENCSFISWPPKPK